MPRVKSVPNLAPGKELDAGTMVVGQDKPRDLPTAGPARLTPLEVEPVQSFTKSHADMLAFMEEKIEVIVHSSTEKNAEPVVLIGVNGINQHFIRNQRQVVKRKFVDRLCQARTTAYTQETFRDGNGDTAIRNIPHTALRYPFSVTRDDNPLGREWLEKTLAE